MFFGTIDNVKTLKILLYEYIQIKIYFNYNGISTWLMTRRKENLEYETNFNNKKNTEHGFPRMNFVSSRERLFVFLSYIIYILFKNTYIYIKYIFLFF